MRSLTFLSVIFLLSACTATTLSHDSLNFRNLTSDSLLFSDLAEKTKALNLPPINKGVDSFELRVWHGISIASPKRLVTLKYQDSAWYLTNTHYWLNYQRTNGSPDKVLLDSSFTKTLGVPSNISSIVDSIFQFRFDTFPSQTEIPGFEDRVADGVFYHVEISTPNFYKAISYNNPSRYEDAYNHRMTKFITMLKGISVFSMR